MQSMFNLLNNQIDRFFPNRSNFESTRSQSNRALDQEVSPTDGSFEPDNTRRTGRGGNYRGRSYRSYNDREGGEGGHDDYRANRRQYDRQPRSFVS